MATRENFSRKRAAILNTLCSTKVHPTAEWIYEKLKPEYPDLSLGTVYRNIRRFCAENKVRSVGVIGGQEHFDGDVSPHSHFVCTGCGAVIDMEEEFFTSAVLEELSHKYGFLLSEENVILKGVCRSCLSDER